MTDLENLVRAVAATTAAREGGVMDDLVQRLLDVASARAKATAHDDPSNYLLVVARLSHEDAALMAEAADAIHSLQAELAVLRGHVLHSAPVAVHEPKP